MKHCSLRVAIVALTVTCVLAGTSDLAGEYADKKFLNGQAVFQMSLEQSGSDVSVFFSAGYQDGHGAAPEADGKGKVTSKGTVEFTWEDGFKNAGTGIIVRSGEGATVSIKTTRVADSRCLIFYRQNIRLPRLKK